MISSTDKLREEIDSVVRKHIVDWKAGHEHLIVEQLMALIESNSKEREIAAKLELGEYIKGYMVSTSPFIEQILQPELDKLNQLRKQEG